MGREREAGSWEPWEGGRKWVTPDGKVAAFYIRKRVGGRRYEVRTPATTESAAHEHLKRFAADPEGYDPAGEAHREKLALDDTLVKEYLAASKAHGNSLGWRRKQKHLLGWWADRLEGVDLRRVSLQDHILPALKRRDATAKHHRVAVLKAFYTWLRTDVHRVTTAEDPVFGQLKIPQIAPAQWTRSKLIEPAHLALVLEHLGKTDARTLTDGRKHEPPPWRDALLLQAGTGWHTTEVIRFAASGSIEPMPKAVVQEGVAGVLVCPQHKSGEPLRTRASATVIEAAKRLLKHGAFSREWYDRAIREACGKIKRPDGKVGIPVFTPGRLRHSVASWAIESGADPAAVAAFLGHKSPRTTRRFYATHAAPSKVPTLA